MDTNTVTVVTTTVAQAVETNNLWDYIQFLSLVLSGFVIGRFLKYFYEQAVARTKLSENGFRRTALELAARTVTFPSALIGICLALQAIVVPVDLQGLLGDVTAVLITIGVTYVIYQMVELAAYWLRHLTSKTQTTLDDMMVPMVRKTLRVVTVILGLVQIAQQLSDKPITSILAGLGVGGLAIALAAQDTIKNFFGSLVIFGDHPFQLGDRIVVDDTDGTIEEVGMRSTRIRTLDGHLVTVPNGELANKTIRNISKRPYIKRVANITITYDTPPEKVERAMEIIKEELNRKNEKFPADFPPRVYFNDFNAASLNILVIYWFAPPEYWDFLEFDQAFNLAVLRRFNEEGIEFAFPTQTLYLAGDPNRPLNLQS
ncbi:MAG: mechanosensitive ion channel family protein [Kiritimatiellales bacterium]|nr:mechanosensitive ion channel family protein [Kiritimatiellales bacterium]